MYTRIRRNTQRQTQIHYNIHEYIEQHKYSAEMILGVVAINYGYSNRLDTNSVPQLTRELVFSDALELHR